MLDLRHRGGGSAASRAASRRARGIATSAPDEATRQRALADHGPGEGTAHDAAAQAEADGRTAVVAEAGKMDIEASPCAATALGEESGGSPFNANADSVTPVSPPTPLDAGPELAAEAEEHLAVDAGGERPLPAALQSGEAEVGADGHEALTTRNEDGDHVVRRAVAKEVSEAGERHTEMPADDDEGLCPTSTEIEWRRTLRDEARAQGVELASSREGGQDSVPDSQDDSSAIEDSKCSNSDVRHASKTPTGGLGMDTDDDDPEAMAQKNSGTVLQRIPRTMSTTASMGDLDPEGMVAQFSGNMCRTEAEQDDWMAHREDEVVFADVVPTSSVPPGAADCCYSIPISPPMPALRIVRCFDRQGEEFIDDAIEQDEVSDTGMGFLFCCRLPKRPRARAASSII